ncbi:putative uncharacterized protein DDB_G0282133 isoform X1 [Pseudomyrmex gracilis]|uniref:putative uncharacterized protein DDB_G0282133 isoform X1 n=2 Tax=Pseudomyrmex gracilis TaxID=219809 RepID=UPI000994D969|nr:putative uncharacterized protein DDB_G0282133 isoform X1 [Pseudomyrmex gracilis]
MKKTMELSTKKMAASALEEKINKIRQQNEEIRRRHEEVEEDKKKAAKLNALVQMVPSTDWPERKEPPEFSNPPRTNNKSKPAKEHHEHPHHQYHSASGEGRKSHTFAQGQGPPPDPKYNFLADAEREEGVVENVKDTLPTKGQKNSKGTFKRKPGGKDGMQRDYRTNRGSHRDEHQPEYEAWRAERNRIDEDRISRQRTAEGNWRREWDNDKAHIVDEVTRSETKLGDYVKKDYKDHDRRYYVNGNDYANHNRGNHRSYRGNAKRFHNNYENRSNNTYHHDGHAKNPGPEERTVVATDKSIKVTLNQGNMTKGSLMSVKVNSPSIAGTGRVGPRQRSRLTYSSHSDVEVTDNEPFSRQKSYEDKTKGIYHDNSQNSVNSRKSQPPPRRKDFGNKSPYFHKKEIKRENSAESPHKRHETELVQKNKSHAHDQVKNEENTEKLEDNEVVNDEKINVTSDKLDANDTGAESNENDPNNASLHADEKNEAQANTDVSQNSDSSESKIEAKTASDLCANEENHEHNEVVCANKDVSRDSDLSESKVEAETERSEANKESEKVADSSSTKDVDDNKSEMINFVENSCAESSTKTTRNDDKNRDVPVEKEQIDEIISNNCDSEQTNDVKCDTKSPEKETDEVAAPIDTPAAAEEEKNELEVANGEIDATTDEANTRDKRSVTELVDEVSLCAARISNDDTNDNEKKKDNATNDDDAAAAAAAESSKEEEVRANEKAQ